MLKLRLPQPRRNKNRLLRTPPASILVLLALLSGCAMRPYDPVEVSNAAFLQRAQTQEADNITISAAVPDAAESAALTGLDLYEDGIQPVWLRVENRGDTPVRVALWSVDRDYFSPIEVAYKHRKKFSSQGYRDMERWFRDNGMTRRVPAGETRSGFVFTHFKQGTKGFNVDIFSSLHPTTFTFFIPMPGFTADYTEVDFAALYTDEQRQNMDQETLRRVLEDELGCCVTDPSGEAEGGPLNTVLVGTPLAVRRSLLRGDWTETQREEMERRSLRDQRYHGRPADTSMTMTREDGNEQIVLQLWLTPWSVGARNVWVGQVYYTTLDQQWLSELAGGSYAADSNFLSQFATESVSADVDGALAFLVQNFWYNQSLESFGLVDGVGASSVENPHATFRGDAFFTAGKRAVLFLSEQPVAIDEARIIYDNWIGARERAQDND